MNKNLLVIIAMLVSTFALNSQSLLIIGEKSYPSTKPILLKANSNKVHKLYVTIGKDADSALLAASTKTETEAKFSGKLIIYLKDGKVISCSKKIASDFIDNKTIAVYTLTAEDINSLKNSNVYLVRYTLDGDHFFTYEYGDWSASNKGIDTRKMISELFSE